MMKSFDILYSLLQVLTFVLYETGSVHLPSTINTRVVEECESIIHRRKDLQHLAVIFTPKKVYEGRSVTICCCSKSLAKSIEIWSGMNTSILSSENDTNVHCHKIINVSSNSSGIFRCFVVNDIGILNADVQVKVEVSYPSDIPDQNIIFTENDASRTLQCLAHGIPSTYTYGQWKHLSNFGEHIRNLNSTADGRVILPEITNKNKRYQDSGIYICSASNGVLSSSRNSFQNGKIFVIANGPPIFVDKIENMQYGHSGKIFNLAFVVYTKSEIEQYTVKRENNHEVPASIQKTSLNSTTIFHGTSIYVEVIEVVLSFKLSSYDNSHMYFVTLCNGHGNNSFVFEIKPGEIVIQDTKVVIVIILAIPGMCVPVSVVAVFLIRKRSKKREIRRIIDDIPEAVEGQPVPVENIVYQDAIALRPIPLQANGEVIEYNYETYSHEQNMRPLSRQLNYSDVYFQPSTSQDVRIRGIENRTVYSEVLNSERGSSVIDSHSVTSSDEEDFVDIEGLDNFIDRSED